MKSVGIPIEIYLMRNKRTVIGRLRTHVNILKMINFVRKKKTTENAD